MFEEVYYKLLDDLKSKNTESAIYKHYLDFINRQNRYYVSECNYSNEENNQIVVDYIASMTDDYFVDLHKHLFPDSKHKLEYVSYFDDIK